MVGEDGDFLDELFDQSLIELCDVGFLTGDEVLQLLDSVHDFFPVVAVEFGLFLLVAQPENLIGDGVIKSQWNLKMSVQVKRLISLPGKVPDDYEVIFELTERSEGESKTSIAFINGFRVGDEYREVRLMN